MSVWLYSHKTDHCRYVSKKIKFFLGLINVNNYKIIVSYIIIHSHPLCLQELNRAQKELWKDGCALTYDVDAAGTEGIRSTGVHMGGVQFLQNPYKVMTIHLRVNEGVRLKVSLWRQISAQFNIRVKKVRLFST